MINNRFFKKFAAISMLLTTLTLSVAGSFSTPVYAASVKQASGTTANTDSNTTNNSDTAKTSADTQTNSGTSSLWPTAPELSSESVILIDADTGAVLYEKDPHQIYYPASTTKILTGLLTIENCSMDEIVTFSKQAAESVDYNDASIGTRKNERFTVEQCLYALLLHSANEIAYGLAEHVSGSLEAFTELMNERAKECGTLNTHFANASGLHDENHYTTAYDMAMIARACYNNSTFVNIDSTYTTYTIPPTNELKEKRYIRHRHEMLKGRDHYYEFCKGGKTGYTSVAGYTLVTFAEKDGIRLICVCFKSGLDTRYTDTRALFEWGFNNFKKITISASAISSLFSSDNYYNSRVFNRYNYEFKLNASTLTIPYNATIGNVTLDINNLVGTAATADTFSTNISFKYQNNVVGSGLLTFAPKDYVTTESNLPYRSLTSADEAPAPRKCFVINVWILIGTGAIILLVLYIRGEMQRIRRQNRRYRRVRGNGTSSSASYSQQSRRRPQNRRR